MEVTVKDPMDDGMNEPLNTQILQRARRAERDLRDARIELATKRAILAADEQVSRHNVNRITKLEMDNEELRQENARLRKHLGELPARRRFAIAVKEYLDELSTASKCIVSGTIGFMIAEIILYATAIIQLL